MLLKLVRASVGKRLLRPDVLPDSIYLVVKGKVRLLGSTSNGSTTLCCRGKGQLLGWISLLRAAPCEWVIASEETILLSIPAEKFIECIENNKDFASEFGSLTSRHELSLVLQSIAQSESHLFDGWEAELNQISSKADSWVVSLYPQDQFRPLDGLPETISWFLSTSDVPNIAVGQKILPGAKLPIRAGFKLPYRLVGVDLENETKSIKALSSNSIQTTEEEFSEKPSQSLVELGILESDSLGVDFKYPIVRGRGQLQQALAVCEMAALQQQVPFRRDAILKVLEGQFRRDKSLSLQLIAGLLELLGLNCQIAEVDCEHLLSVEAPAVFF